MTNPNTTDVRAGRIFAAFWRPVGLIYLAMLLAGLAAGFWPQAIVTHITDGPVPLPVLQTLAIAQVAFLLLIHPLAVACRAAKGLPAVRLSHVVVESVGLLIAAVPFYMIAAWFSNAVWIDVVRVVLFVLCLWTFSWAAMFWIVRRRCRLAVLLMLWLVALGFPLACYVAREFFPSGAAEAVWAASPALFAWIIAEPWRTWWGPWFSPWQWGWLLWPIVAIVLWALGVLVDSVVAGHCRAGKEN